MPIALAPPRSQSLHTSKPIKNASKTAKPLYASDSSLPHLPVPTLSSTFHKYLETLIPLHSPSSHKSSTDKIKSFLASDYAQTLQSRLEKRSGEKESWLSEWWNETAYMGYRGRIVPNVSYFYVHHRGAGNGVGQDERAAELVRAVVEFKKLVDR